MPGSTPAPSSKFFVVPPYTVYLLRTYLLVSALGRVSLVLGHRSPLRPPVELPVLDLDLAPAGAVGGIAHAADLGLDLLQVGRAGHTDLHPVHRDCRRKG